MKIRFRLSTMFLMMTVAAIPAWYCAQPFVWRRQAARVERLGGHIGMRPKSLGFFGAAYRWVNNGKTYVPINFVTDFHPSRQQILSRQEDKVELDELLHLASALPTLEKIDFTDMPFTDKNLRHLEKLKNVRYLSLYNCPVGDEAMKYIARMPRLETLSLQGTLVSDKGVEKLADLKNLKHLALRETRITEVAVHQIREIASLERVELPPKLASIWKKR